MSEFKVGGQAAFEKADRMLDEVTRWIADRGSTRICRLAGIRKRESG
jgi:hypothetical protein